MESTTHNHNPKQSMDDLIAHAIDLAENQYNCSQILIKLALEVEGVNNPDLIRSVGGLGDGCGFQKGTCGLLTGAACLLAWYNGRHDGKEIRSETLLPMLQDLNQWFENEIKADYASNRCKDIIGEVSGLEEKRMICGRLLLSTYSKCNEILSEYDLI